MKMMCRSLLSLATVAAVVATSAWAVPVRFSTASGGQLLLHSGPLALWTVDNDSGTSDGTPTGSCTNTVPGLAVHEAALDPAGANRSDAIDGAFTVWIDDVELVSPDTVDVTEDTLTAGPVTMSGLDVTVEYRAMPSTPTLRARVALHNPSAAPVGVGFRVATNLGSDAATGTSSVGANWTVTSDDPVSPHDPVVVMVPFGSDSKASFTDVPLSKVFANTFECNGTQGSELRRPTLVVPPGDTLYVMQFIRLAATNAEGLADGQMFTFDPPRESELFADLSDAVLFSTVNWNFFGDLRLGGGDGSEWALGGFVGTSNNLATGGACVPAPGLGISVSRRVDAESDVNGLDAGLRLFVGGASFLPSDAIVHQGSTATIGPATLAGLDATMTYVAFLDGPTLRCLVTLHNGTSAAIATTAQMANNFASDERTTVAATSSGALAIASGERWVITTDSLTPPQGAVNTSVVAGPGSLLPVLPTLDANVFDCAGTEGLLASFALTIGPGETQSLLFFQQIHLDVPSAMLDSEAFDQTPAPGAALVAGLDNPTLAGIVNWGTCRGPSYAEARCHIDGLTADVTANGTAGTALTKLLGHLSAATTALGKAETGASAGKKAGARRGLRAASAAFKTFEQMLKSKRLKTVLADPVRARLRATSKDLRQQIKGLPIAP